MKEEESKVLSEDPELRLKALFLRQYFQNHGDIQTSLESVQVTPLQLIGWKQKDPWFSRMFEEHKEMIVDSAAMKILAQGVCEAGTARASTTLKALAQISQKYDTDYRKVVAVQEAVARARGYFTKQIPEETSSEHPWQQHQGGSAHDPILAEKSKHADAIIDAEFTTQSQGPEDI